MNTQRNRVGRQGHAALVFPGLGLASLLMISGCGGSSPPPPTGSEKYEAERQAYRVVRGKEYGRKSIDPGEDKTRRGSDTKKGRPR